MSKSQNSYPISVDSIHVMPVEAYPVHDAPSSQYPAIPNIAPVNSLGGRVNIAGVKEYLSESQWPVGLQDKVIQSFEKVPIRYFICDDSGSMNEGDGSRLIKSRSGYSFVTSSRWTELTDALTFHVGLAHASGSFAEFRLLNGSAPITISPSYPENAAIFRSLLQGSPTGGTPLCRHIREVIAQVRVHEQYLRAHGQKACIIIATDGESSDGDIAAAMKPLEQLPVWVVVRLCTNDEKIVNYWNNIDRALELEIDVLDDLQGEAQEIHEHNSWLTYAEPLHRLREFGIPVREIDLLDEAKLSSDQMTVIVSTIFGGRPDSYPNPQLDFRAFINYVDSKQKSLSNVYDPITKRMKTWIKVSEIERTYRPDRKCSIM